MLQLAFLVMHYLVNSTGISRLRTVEAVDSIVSVFEYRSFAFLFYVALVYFLYLVLRSLIRDLCQRPLTFKADWQIWGWIDWKINERNIEFQPLTWIEWQLWACFERLYPSNSLVFDLKTHELNLSGLNKNEMHFFHRTLCKVMEWYMFSNHDDRDPSRIPENQDDSLPITKFLFGEAPKSRRRNHIFAFYSRGFGGIDSA